jgi:hypothetical protein
MYLTFVSFMTFAIQCSLRILDSLKERYSPHDDGDDCQDGISGYLIQCFDLSMIFVVVGRHKYILW